jgi:hypothetical protein
MGQIRLHLKMKNTNQLRLPGNHLIARCLLLGITSVITSQASVIITSSFILNTGTNLYTYSYSVENTGIQDLALVSIPASATAGVFGISSPAGFSLTFDPFLGFISLIEDSDLFTGQSFASGSTTSPFQFTSALAPGSVTYTAFDVGGNEFTGSAVAPIPEPSALLLTTVTLMTATSRRRR